MKVTKKQDHVLFKNDKGEYHLSIDRFNEMGEEKAKKFAESEINKKSTSGVYQNETINFEQARALGFCEYGIKNFCNNLKIDIKKEYNIKDLLKKLDVKTFLEYSSECLKLFGDSVFDKFGGAKKFLEDNRSPKARDVILRSGVLSDKQKHVLACKFAESTLHYFEEIYPEDDRPRKAIEIKREWIEHYFGPINEKY